MLLIELYPFVVVVELDLKHGIRHGFKMGEAKPLLNLKVSRSLILIYIKLSKILNMLLSIKNAVGC